MRASLVLLLVSACGASSTPTRDTPAGGPPASVVATPASTDDVVVATVNGKPVYASCVSVQAGRGATKQQALDQCIGFELLAQEADARELETDAEVALATRTALVSQLIAREYEDKFTKPSDFGAFWDRSIERNKQQIDHGEARASAYIRIPVDAKAPPDVDAKARALAEELASELAKERGLMAIHLQEIATRVIGDRAKLAYQAIPPFLDDKSLDPSYAKALFAIPEVGRTSAAVKTPWGWDVILLTDLIPAKKLTPAEVAEKYLPDIKRSYFNLWAQQVTASLGIGVKRFEENIPLLEDL